MKKVIMTIAIVLTMGLSASAQTSLLGKENSYDESFRDEPGSTTPFVLPSSHGDEGDSDAPIGSGIAVLMGLGAAYLVGKKHKND